MEHSYYSLTAIFTFQSTIFAQLQPAPLLLSIRVRITASKTITSHLYRNLFCTKDTRYSSRFEHTCRQRGLMLVIIAALPQPSGTSVAILIFLKSSFFIILLKIGRKRGYWKKREPPRRPGLTPAICLWTSDGVVHNPRHAPRILRRLQRHIFDLFLFRLKLFCFRHLEWTPLRCKLHF